MDDPASSLDPLNHFDDGEIEKSILRMRERYDAIRTEVQTPEEAPVILGQILHAAQDFMSHSNYAEIMVRIQRGARAERIEAPPPMDLVSLFDDPHAALMADSFQVPKSYEPLIRRAIENGELTSGYICLLDYPFDLLGKIPILGWVTDATRQIIAVPGTLIGALPLVGKYSKFVLPVLKSHHNMAKDERDWPSSRAPVDDGQTIYDLCLKTAVKQTRYEFEHNFLRAAARNPKLRGTHWAEWQK
jgi:hypothetical protein